MQMSDSDERRGTPAEVFGAFLRLGLTSFGGPIAHLGYFRAEFVLKRRWLEDAAYAELVGLCQFLPGPASSQTGFVLGWQRAGPLGAFAAWTGFTLPSALVMAALGLGAAHLEGPLAASLVHGLKLVAIVIVAQAVWGMARTLTPDLTRRAIAIVTALLVALSPGAVAQIGAIMLGGLLGLLLCRRTTAEVGDSTALPITRPLALLLLALFAGLLAGTASFAADRNHPLLSLFAIFYRAGALVFGGGHVVLPLLRSELVPAGLIGDDDFLAGYGAAQALPGPLFAIAAYVGALSGGTIPSALAALLCIFAPGLLIVSGAFPFWTAIRASVLARATVAGVNAAVVGILAHALYDPLWTTGITGFGDIVLVAIGLALLLLRKLPPVIVVGAMVAGSIVLHLSS